jgi:hypothetical protein
MILFLNVVLDAPAPGLSTPPQELAAVGPDHAEKQVLDRGLPSAVAEPDGGVHGILLLRFGRLLKEAYLLGGCAF